MGSKILHSLEDRFSRDEYVVFDDFLSYNDADLWTVANTGVGTTLGHEGSVGRSTLKFLTTTSTNDYATLATTNELFEFLANKAIVCEGRIIFTDGTDNTGMIAVGFANAIAGATMADTTGAITANDACLIYKLPSTTVWAFHTEVNGAATATVSDTTAGGSAFQTLRIEIVPRSATTLEARPYVDGVQLKTAAGVPIKHDITPLTTTTEMDFGMIHKTMHTDDFTSYCDYLYAAQVRT
jgi:hypothetical protein